MSIETAYKNCLVFMESDPNKYYVVNPQTHQFQPYQMTALNTRYPRQEDVINALNDMIKIIQERKPADANQLAEFQVEFITSVVDKYRACMANGLKNLQRSMYPEDAKLLPGVIHNYLSDGGLLANAKQRALPPPAPPPLPDLKQKPPPQKKVVEKVDNSCKVMKVLDPLQTELKIKLATRVQSNIEEIIPTTKKNKPDELVSILHKAIENRRGFFQESAIIETSEIFE